MNFPIFEAIMLLCFGLAWPISIFTSWKSRTNKGKSILFILVVLFGYISGLIHKIYWQNKVDGVVWLYILNAAMVIIDIILYIRNIKLDKARGQGAGGHQSPIVNTQ